MYSPIHFSLERICVCPWILYYSGERAAHQCSTFEDVEDELLHERGVRLHDLHSRLPFFELLHDVSDVRLRLIRVRMIQALGNL